MRTGFDQKNSIATPNVSGNEKKTIQACKYVIIVWNEEKKMKNGYQNYET